MYHYIASVHKVHGSVKSMNLLSNLNEFGEENNLICRGKQFDLPSYGYYLLNINMLHGQQNYVR